MKKTLALLLCAAVFGFSSASVLAQTMDFESYPDELTCEALAYEENGLVLTSNQPENCVFGPSAPVNHNGTNVFGWCADCDVPSQILTLESESGAPFDFYSFSAAALQANDGFPHDLQVTAYFNAGGTEQTTVAVPAAVWTGFVFLGWNDLDRVEFQLTGDFLADTAIDNLRTSAQAQAVSVPSLSQTGLIGLFLLLLLVGGREVWLRKA